MKHLKQEFDKLTLKEFILYTLAVISMVAGLTLLFLALFIEPEGQIHSSVIYSFAMICVFVSSLLGLSMKYQAELEKFKQEVSKILGGLSQCESQEDSI